MICSEGRKVRQEVGWKDGGATGAMAARAVEGLFALPAPIAPLREIAAAGGV